MKKVYETAAKALDVTHKGLHIIECADGVTREELIAAT